MRATAPNGRRPRRRRLGRATAPGEGAARRRRNDGRAVNGGHERMDKRLLGLCRRVRRVWQKMPVLGLTATFLLVFFVSLLAWVAFGSQDNCSGDMLCRLLGVTEKKRSHQAAWACHCRRSGFLGGGGGQSKS